MSENDLAVARMLAQLRLEFLSGYAAGQQDGFQAGYGLGVQSGRLIERAYVQEEMADHDEYIQAALVDALARVLGGPNATSYSEGVRAHLRMMVAKQARENEDTQEMTTSYTGGPVPSW